MHVLALEPYYGGSHRAFLDGWQRHSRHTWTTLTLPPYKWKWRMRHSAVHFAALLRERGLDDCQALFCSDMLNLAELRGLCPAVTRIPNVLYFHENQLTYPVRHEDERDYHFVLTNLVSALAADTVWFNSGYHRDDLLTALPDFLRRMPDHQPLAAVEQIAARARVLWPGIDVPEAAPAGDGRDGPLHVVWAARWEHDKGPETLFAALELLADRGQSIRLSVLGEQFRDSPPVFAEGRQRFADWIENWGFQSAERYREILASADLFVSTAEHEFFGLSAAEAIARGTRPLLPDRLAYPELLAACGLDAGRHLYDGTAEGLAAGIAAAGRGRLESDAGAGLLWPQRAAVLDAALEG